MKILSSPTIRFTQRAFQQITALTEECDIEISAMGVIATKEYKRQKGVTEDFYILEFRVPKQECTSGSTTIEAEDLSKLTFDLMRKGVKPEQICVWWHSHVNMPVGHSSTDEEQIENFNFDRVCISIITNKMGDINIRVDQYEPVRYSFEGCEHSIDKISILADGWAKEMVSEHVTEALVLPSAAYLKRLPNYHTQYLMNTQYPPLKNQGHLTQTPNQFLDAGQVEVNHCDEVLYTNQESVLRYENEDDVSDQPEIIQILVDHYQEGRLEMSQLMTHSGQFFRGEVDIPLIVNGDDVDSIIRMFEEPEPEPKQKKRKKRK